jgi:hypothetical protein
MGWMMVFPYEIHAVEIQFTGLGLKRATASENLQHACWNYAQSVTGHYTCQLICRRPRIWLPRKSR